jgi:peptidoglycan-N-acetylglucosamine deacetylase
VSASPPTVRGDVRSYVDAGISTSLEWLAGARRRLPGGARNVALTFDDGPDPVFTPQVLDALGAERAPATFFVVGEQAARHPALVRRIIDEGHAIGSHSGSHADPHGTRGLLDEYRRGAAVVSEVSGQPVRRFRPPFGRVGRRGAIATRVAGLRSWLWSADPNDWDPQVSVESIVDVAHRAAPGEIVLLHDGMQSPVVPAAADRSSTVAALVPLIHSLRARDLTLVALP